MRTEADTLAQTGNPGPTLSPLTGGRLKMRPAVCERKVRRFSLGRRSESPPLAAGGSVSARRTVASPLPDTTRATPTVRAGTLQCDAASQRGQGVPRHRQVRHLPIEDEVEKDIGRRAEEAG